MDATDAQDVTLAQAGDEAAFRRLVERHSRGLFQLAFRLTGNEPDAEDIVQDAFLKVYRELKRFEARSSFRTWLHRITVNCAYDLLRKRPRFEAEPIGGDGGEAAGFEPEAAPSGQPDRAAYGAEVQDRVRQAMAQLTPTERAAFVLRHFEGRPLDEIGSALGLQLSATKHSIFRAVQKMRRALRPVVGGLGQFGVPAAYPGEERP
ncbi:MAG: sigma-70 family RNA polymerase sigma factor [Acidobacteria bacterium]|nr:MAG: sigma-70 family RNA polymerase sigma factor [Acidobacteriota bacterium]